MSCNKNSCSGITAAAKSAAVSSAEPPSSVDATASASAADENEKEIEVAEETGPKFWSEDPNVLLSQKYLLEFFPTENMTFNQKLNAVSRLILIMTILGFIYTKSIRILIISAIIFGCIFFLHLNEKRRLSKSRQEGYDNPSMEYAPVRDLKKDFLAPTPNNPFGNVLMTDYEDDPTRLPAPPVDNPLIANQVLESAKQFVIKHNSGQPDIAEKLFHDLGDNFEFEQSMRPFYSNPATEIPNDQSAFAEFCYGGMTSCKEGNNFACARNLPRHTMT
jgi:hypothetical protein